MARPREFEPNEALNQAMHLFWQKGYEETSMADLVQVTGVSRYGFYNEFGDKHDLFLRCIDHYAQTVIERALAPMEQPDSGLREIQAYFADLIAATRSERPAIGCLIGNTAVTSAAWDTAVASRIAHHYTRMQAAFYHALQVAQQTGELGTNEDVGALADYLVGVANGYLAGLRSMQPEAVRRYIQISLARLG